jgi:hypothetical protein
MEGDRRALSCDPDPDPRRTPISHDLADGAGFLLDNFERKSVGVYVCPACAAVLTLTAGSIVPRPCPQCLESTGRVVEMVQQEPQPPGSPALKQQ